MKEKTVFVSGMGQTGVYWHNYVSWFTNEGYECHVPVLRCHNKEDNHQLSPNTGLRDYVADLAAYVREFDEPVHLVGHSMGGLLVQILASMDLDIKSQVLISPAAPGGMNSLCFSTIWTFKKILTTSHFWERLVKPSFAAVRYGLLNGIPSDDEQERIYSNFVNESGRAIFEMGCWFLDISGASIVDESLVRCPTFVITGKNDRGIPARFGEKVAKKYGKVVPVEYQEYDRGHWALEEPGWEEICHDIFNWW